LQPDEVIRQPDFGRLVLLEHDDQPTLKRGGVSGQHGLAAFVPSVHVTLDELLELFMGQQHHLLDGAGPGRVVVNQEQQAAEKTATATSVVAPKMSPWLVVCRAAASCTDGAGRPSVPARLPPGVPAVTPPARGSAASSAD
jgi:hypothetical protein